MDVLLLRLEAPLMSFGAPIVDYRGVIQPYPALSMICGLLANAMGYHHRDTDALQRLQERIRYACRQDRAGTRLRDFQTVSLKQEFMRDDRAWTTRGETEERAGGDASKWRHGQGPPHIRKRDYWADAAYTVAIALDPPEETPEIDDLANAVDAPERPLFIGRKPCLPATQLLLGRDRAEDLLEALRRAPLPDTVEPTERLTAWWPSRPGAEWAEGMSRPVTDGRDWANQIHVGERWIASGWIELAQEEDADG